MALLINHWMNDYAHWMNDYAGDYTFDQWCDAIKHEEGATYGVGNFSDPRQVCINTVIHKYKDWLVVRNALDQQEFLEYLSTKYCPLNSKSWAHNVQYWLTKGN